MWNIWTQQGFTINGTFHWMWQKYAIEYLFHATKALVIEDAMMPSRKIFGPGVCPYIDVSVHIRWGDKWKERALSPVSVYIDAVKKMVGESIANIWVMTEDPCALSCFEKEKPEAWNIFYHDAAISRVISQCVALWSERN